MVDYVTLFDETTPIKTLEMIRPDVHVNGEEYGRNCVEAGTLKRIGARLHIVKRIGDFSTTVMIERGKKMR